jgi:hypothetical protein
MDAHGMFGHAFMQQCLDHWNACNMHMNMDVLGIGWCVHLRQCLDHWNACNMHINMDVLGMNGVLVMPEFLITRIVSIMQLQMDVRMRTMI